MTAADADRASDSRVRAQRTRRVVAVFLVVVTAFGMVLTPAAWWLRTQLFDTDSFVSIVEPTLASEEVTDALAEPIAAAVIELVELDDRLSSRLGGVDEFIRSDLPDILGLGPASRRLLERIDLPELADLAGPISAAFEQAVEDRTRELLRSPAIQDALPAALGRTHEAAVALLRDDLEALPNVSVVDGEVTWDVAAVVAAVLRSMIEERFAGSLFADISLPPVVATAAADQTVAALESAFGVTLPDDFAQIRIMSEDDLRGWQRLARTVDRLVWAITIVTLTIAATAVAVSPHRRRTLVQLGFGVVAALVLFNRLISNVATAFEEAVTDPDSAAAVRVVAGELASGLRAIIVALIGVAAAVAVTAHLLGSPSWLQQVRRQIGGEPEAMDRIQPLIAAHRDGFIAAGIVAAVALLWWLGIGLFSLLLVSGALALYLTYVLLVGRRPEPEPEIRQPEADSAST